MEIGGQSSWLFSLSFAGVLFMQFMNRPALGRSVLLGFLFVTVFCEIYVFFVGDFLFGVDI